jgi:hypothetical protein
VLPLPCDNDFFILSVTKGAQNLDLHINLFKPAKFFMTFHLQKILGYEIATSHWKQDSKVVCWPASCVAFFGSFRIGEILPGENSKIHFETMTCHRIHFTKKTFAIINIQIPKAVKKNTGGFCRYF